MDITEDISDFFLTPYKMAAPLYEKAANGDSFRETLAPRALMVLQAVVSRYVLTYIAILGLIEVLYKACTGDNWRRTASMLIAATALHSLATPYSAAAAFLPSKFIVNTAYEARSLFEEKMITYYPRATAVAI